MSSALSQQVKWHSFLLLLIILFVELPSPATGGVCQTRCDKNRPSRYEAVKIDCQEEYDYNDYYDDELEKCKDDCESCSNICDSSEPHIFNCPAIDLARCEKHCDANRPSGSTSAYTLDCEKKYQSKDEVDKCKSQCDICRSEICDSDKPSIFECPAVINASPTISEGCKEQCDEIREDENPYSLHCGKTGDYKKCITNCNLCPRQVCNPYDPELFNCPKGPTVCELHCDRNRPKGSTTAYTHQCTPNWYNPDSCKYECGLCPQICSLNDPETFNCPAKGTPLPTAATTTTTTTTPTTTTTTTTTPPPTTLPTYEGRCEDRCNDKRPKGSREAYKLECNAYGSEKEKQECENDCGFCPSNICEKHHFGGTEYDCPYIKITRRCEDFCKAQRSRQHSHYHRESGSFRFSCYEHYQTLPEKEYCLSVCKDCESECVSQYGRSEYNCPAIQIPTGGGAEPSTKDPSQESDDAGSGQLSTLTIVAIVLGIVLLLLVVGGVIFFVIRKRKAKKQVEPGQVPAGPVKPAWSEFEQSEELSPDISEPISSSLSIAESVSSLQSSSTIIAEPTPKSKHKHKHKHKK